MLLPIEVKAGSTIPGDALDGMRWWTELPGNEDKADANLRKHGVGFDEASSVFADPLSLLMPDPDPPYFSAASGPT